MNDHQRKGEKDYSSKKEAPEKMEHEQERKEKEKRGEMIRG